MCFIDSYKSKYSNPFSKLIQIFISKMAVHSLQQCVYVKSNVNKGASELDTPLIPMFGMTLANSEYLIDNLGHLIDNLGYLIDNPEHLIDNLGYLIDNPKHLIDNPHSLHNPFT